MAAAWAILLVARRDRTLGVGLAAILMALVAHSLLYAGFFEDPLTWGVLGVAAAALASMPVRAMDGVTEPETAPPTPQVLAH